MTSSSSNQTTKATKIPLTSTISLQTVLLLVATLSVASAFNNNAYTSKAAQTASRQSRSDSTGIYGSLSRIKNVNSGRIPSLSSSPTSSSRVMRRQQTSTLTRLQFSDDSSSNTAIESRWWKKLFTPLPSSPNSSTTTTSSSESEEQDNVDAYLEFLDRRYRRLHSDDTEEKETTQSKQQESKSFSALEWLTNGNSNANVVTTTREQQEDALYVLGVAGLASEKLLHKHHLPTTGSSRTISPDTSNEGIPTTILPTIEKVVELKEQIDDAIEVNEDGSTPLNHIELFVVKKVLIPIVRAIYLVQRQKHLFLQMIQQRVKSMAIRATKGVVQTVSQGPKSILDALITVGGGRQNILRTMAIGYATIIVFRPLLQAAFAEGLAIDPLIQ